jgi:hypothetical protein
MHIPAAQDKPFAHSRIPSPHRETALRSNVDPRIARSHASRRRERSWKLMLAILVLVVGFVTILAVLLLVIVVIGIRQELPTEELSEQAPSLIAAFVRRLLGTYVRKPYSPHNLDQGGKGHASLCATPLARPADKPNAK